MDSQVNLILGLISAKYAEIRNCEPDVSEATENGDQIGKILFAESDYWLRKTINDTEFNTTLVAYDNGQCVGYITFENSDGDRTKLLEKKKQILTEGTEAQDIMLSLMCNTLDNTLQEKISPELLEMSYKIKEFLYTTDEETFPNCIAIKHMNAYLGAQQDIDAKEFSSYSKDICEKLLTATINHIKRHKEIIAITFIIDAAATPLIELLKAHNFVKVDLQGNRYVYALPINIINKGRL